MVLIGRVHCGILCAGLAGTAIYRVYSTLIC